MRVGCRSPEGSRSIATGARGFSRAFAITLIVLGVACGGGGLFRQYEYEEEMYLSLDGSATMYVNSSVAALNALRGTSFDTSPTAPLDRERVRAYFSGPNTHVTWVRPSRRNGRRFIHVRLEVDDVRRLAETKPFAWSSYRFERRDSVFVFLQSVGPPARMPGYEGHTVVSPRGEVSITDGIPAPDGWTGRRFTGGEIVAFRLHLPSKIEYQNTSPPKRGNILVWEQSLAERWTGSPLELEARMQTQSILYRTLWLFAATFLAVAVGFGFLLWWILRRGAANGVRADPRVPPPPGTSAAPGFGEARRSATREGGRPGPTPGSAPTAR